MSIVNRLLKNPSHVIARSSFCDEAISNPLILLKARLPRFARNDRKKTFSTACPHLTFSLWERGGSIFDFFNPQIEEHTCFVRQDLKCSQVFVERNLSKPLFFRAFFSFSSPVNKQPLISRANATKGVSFSSISLHRVYARR